MTTLTESKVITFNKDTHDFDAYFEDQYIGSFPTQHQAENELNQHVLRLCEDGLIDQPLAALAEQALIAANPEPQPPIDDDPEAVNWNSRAAVVVPNPGLHLSSYTVYDRPGEHGSRAAHLCDDCAAKRRADGTMAAKWSGECINGYCDDCKAGPSVSHFHLADDPPPAPPVDDGPADNFGGWYAPGYCRNCGQPHATQRCPEILAALRADPDDGPPPPWDAPDAGRAVGRQWLRDRARFLTVLAHLDRDAWTVLAAAYCAWMNRGGCGLDPAHVVLIWTKALERDIALPPKAA